MTTDLTEALAAHKELAKEATPGPLVPDAEDLFIDGGDGPTPIGFFDVPERTRQENTANLAFIAANSPERIAALIDVAEALSVEHNLIEKRLNRDRRSPTPIEELTTENIHRQVEEVRVASLKLTDAQEKSTDALDRLKAAYKEKETQDG